MLDAPRTAFLGPRWAAVELWPRLAVRRRIAVASGLENQAIWKSSKTLPETDPLRVPCRDVFYRESLGDLLCNGRPSCGNATRTPGYAAMYRRCRCEP
jgi:hypothetical protein